MDMQADLGLPCSDILDDTFSRGADHLLLFVTITTCSKFYLQFQVVLMSPVFCYG